MGASFLKTAWLIPGQLQRWQRTAIAHIKRQVPPVKDVVWVFTSGSQSVERIKCVALSHEAILESAKAVNSHLQSTSKDVWSIEIPDYHIGGFSIYARAHLSGAKIVMGGKWHPQKYVKRVKDKRVTLSSLVPTQVYDFTSANLKAPESLRAVVVGGGALDANVYRKARELGWPLLPSYGLTECASQIATAPLESLSSQEFPGLSVLNHVRIDFRHQRVFLQCLSACQWIAAAKEDGQFTMEDPLRDGWLATEDMGEYKGISLPGRPPQIRILGRRDEVVKIFGVLVSLPQVESDLRKFGMPGDFTLIGVGGEREGTKIVLVTEKAKEPFEAAIKKYNAAVSGPYRVQQVRQVTKIPRTSLGKVKKAELCLL